MKTFFTTSISLIILLNVADAQFSENFDQGLTSLTSNCWTMTSGIIYTTSATNVINGTGSLYIDPSPNNSVESVATPFLNVNSTSFTVSFKYKLTSKLATNATRIINIGLTDKNGVFNSLETITLNKNSSTSVVNQNSTYTLPATGVFRLEILNSSVNGDGNSKIIIDDLWASASAYYGPVSLCNPAAAANNDTYSSSTISTVTGNVLFNDNIPADNDSYSVALVSAPSTGTLVLNANGSFTYTPSTTYTGGTISFSYKINDNGYSPTTSNTALVNINYASPVVLPIRLISFIATVSGSIVEVKWIADDNNTGDYFEIEKSYDGKTFSAIEKIYATINEGVKEYRYFDGFSGAAVRYRLKIVNKDLSVSYSKVAMIKGNAETLGLQVTENPVRAKLGISYSSSEVSQALISVYTIAGIKVYNEKANVNNGTNSIRVAVDNLNPGIYIITVSTSTSRQAVRFVKS
ncbi:MAG TPA: Ig-like domain-containing protein [Flavitalea sp.]|nr:Ig-like domain-containing protein [Flavitalea sp.]